MYNKQVKNNLGSSSLADTRALNKPGFRIADTPQQSWNNKGP